MAQKFQFTEEGVEFIKSFCAWITPTEEFYFVPYVFKKVEGKKSQFYMLKLEDVPDDIRLQIQELSLPSLIQSDPKTPKEVLLQKNLEGQFD